MRLHAVTQTTPRAIIYLRQSVHRDESISLELQEIACRDYCARMGYDVIAVEADPGISGRTWNRPAVQRVMEAIEARTADIVILWKWSRLSRSRKDWALAIDKADVAGGRIESATEPIDTATASGRFARGVMTEYAAFQSEQIGEQWEEVRQRRLRLGLPASGRLPFGWEWVDGQVHAHPQHAPLVVEMYRRYLAGDGAAAIAKWLNESGVPSPNGGLWLRARPLDVMDSPIHVGEIPYRGGTFPGAHEPIIDRPTWDAYQVEREARRTQGRKPRQRAHMLSQLMICECGARMSGKGSVTGGKWYGGYLCGSTLNGHPQRAYVSARRVEPAIENWILTFDPDLEPTTVPSRAERDRLNREVNALQVELTNLTRQLGKGIIPEAAYVTAVAEIEAAIAAHDANLQRLRAVKSPPSAVELGELREAWPEMSTPEKNRAARQLLTRIEVLNDGSTLRLRTQWGSSAEIRP
jgi:DNA invertase Pin-like site-specific DNA recombinase